ncbi:MAG: zinc-dependent alcohol dehydrogenase family protein [Candidatus Dadabacteria bacterium]|nr:zinc-dependent alcohol dehydrogenase family protein [Candidatus Dadabacteria bacterium]NIS09798.1 zinc-dependent alcohol dehydrogenase family protein [Candidatus Dadabacteria bacterium]NIV41154.1 zinc-binding alcohol dehydrogenase family protein [Candidatus Dadabacteria bacterium]NIX16239.1 zinc-binding alcohol dehydrogenase family protein [Candidatus Dadabacteria bacterium]NIY22859.1 zinc-binding alcohol dehydrogenase family protein [Candidatus Dadabacteria bacterium]
MKAMILEEAGSPLTSKDIPAPVPSSDQFLVKVKACAVCRTDLHIIDGELKEPKLPLVLGHEIVGEITELGGSVNNFKVGDMVGVPWLGKTCGNCRFCKSGKENLCDHARFTGYQIDGGYAEYAAANHSYCFTIPEDYSPINAAPLLCAGLIGYRSYKMVKDSKKIGLYGFGAAAHIIAQVAVFEGKELYAFTKPGDKEAQEFAIKLGCKWAGDSDKIPPEQLDSAIIFAPVGRLVPTALKSVVKGGTVVCAGIHMSDIPSFPYDILWGEREIKSVANLTRKDGEQFFKIAPKVPVKTEVETFPLEQANEALNSLRDGKINGAAVLVMDL